VSCSARAGDAFGASPSFSGPVCTASTSPTRVRGAPRQLRPRADRAQRRSGRAARPRAGGGVSAGQRPDGAGGGRGGQAVGPFGAGMSLKKERPVVVARHGRGDTRATPGVILPDPVWASANVDGDLPDPGASARSGLVARRQRTLPRVPWLSAPPIGARARGVRPVGRRGGAVAGGRRHRTATIAGVQGTMEAVQATMEAVQATIEAVQPTIEAVQATIEAVQATIEAVQATIEAVQPADGSCTGSIVSCTRPIVCCTRPIVCCTRSIVSCTRPIVCCTRSIVACTRPIVGCTRAIVASGCPDGRSGRWRARPRRRHPAGVATGVGLPGPRRGELAAAGVAGLRAEGSRLQLARHVPGRHRRVHQEELTGLRCAWA
jgi:hypothetical protein